MSEKGSEKSMENVGDYRKREIEFTSLKNVISYCAMINQKSFDLYRMAEVLNTDYEFLRRWASGNLWLINKILIQYREEVADEARRRSVEGEGQGQGETSSGAGVGDGGQGPDGDSEGESSREGEGGGDE